MAKDAGGLSGALDYIGALNVATKITTVIGLAALAVIVAFLLSSQWLSGRRAQISQAIDKGDDQALAALLGTMNVSLDGMSAAEKVAAAREESRRRFWQKMVWQSFLFAGFLALLLLVWALVQPKPVSAGGADQTRLMERMLLPWPEDQRQELCEKALDSATCAGIVKGIAGYGRVASAEEKARIATSLEEGSIYKSLQLDPVLTKQTKGTTRLTAGDPKGWDVVVYWCPSVVAGRNEAAAMATARALAQTPGEQIAPGVKLGAIDVRRSDQAEGAGAYILADLGRASTEAATAIRTTLAARGIDRYELRVTTGGPKWQVALYACESSIGTKRRVTS